MDDGQNVVCPRCGEFFWTKSKFPICRKCEYENVIILDEKTGEEYWNVLYNQGIEKAREYEEQLREKYVYNSDAFSKKYYNQRLDKDNQAKEEQKQMWHDHPTCPKCYSMNTYRTTQEFNVKRSIVGSFLAGTTGAIIGGKSSSGQEICVCRQCGHKWKE